MKKLLSIMLALVMIVSASGMCASASRETAGVAVWFGEKIGWWENSDTPDVLYFSGIGPMYDFNFETPTHGEDNYLSEVEDLFDKECVVVEEGITYIGENIFTMHKNTKEVTIADSVTEIHENAFSENSNIIIKGSADSYAVEYAKQNGMKYEIIEFEVLLGDTNHDLSVNGKDVLELRKYLVGLNYHISILNADVNGDGNLNGKDVLVLRKYILGLVDIVA